MTLLQFLSRLVYKMDGFYFFACKKRILKIYLASIFLIAVLIFSQLSLTLHISQLSRGFYEHSSNLSLLVIVTGGWAVERYRDEKHADYLLRIIGNYVAVCESGFDVTVILITYDRMPDGDALPRSWLPDWTDPKYVCHRLGRSVPVTIELFPFRPLPEGTHGTAGDLAIRHREIFYREQTNFDVFLLQEDDIGFDVNTLNYFVHFCSLFQKNSGTFHPGLFGYEFYKGEKYVDVTLSSGSVFLINGEPYFKPEKVNSGGRGYILFREDLLKVCNEKSWSDSSAVSGEFNIEVAMDVWIEKSNTLGKSLVFPLYNWQSAGIYHFPQKYIAGYFGGVGYPTYFTVLSEEEQHYIFSSCLDIERSFDISEKKNNVTLLGESCRDCLTMNKTARFNSLSWQEMDVERSSRWINTTFFCS